MSIETPVLPGIEWPEPVLTADTIINNSLEDALKAGEFFGEAVRAGMKFEPKDPSPEAQVARWRRNAYLYNMVGATGTAALLVMIQGLAPGLADKLLNEWHERMEAGDVMAEFVWEWATERGLDPEEIKAEAATTWKEMHGG
ncbi:hypothetical protein ACSYDW_07205 [Paeniglutamicibacter sp. R2-26]|uniref:hypothetical protein n=1 Tax=Paeniglutamicibacter sp. R2-26 TaxID=3144417 RepID=UPI003EE57349